MPIQSPNIPLTPQTNPGAYPQWDPKAPPGRSGHPWPKLLTRVFTIADRDEWQAKHRKFENGQPTYSERCPRVGAIVPVTATQEIVDKGFADYVGQDLIANSEAEEKDLLVLLGLDKPAAPAPVFTVEAKAPTAILEAENAQLRALLEEKQKLEAALAEKPAEATAAKKRGRPKKQPAPITLDDLVAKSE